MIYKKEDEKKSEKSAVELKRGLRRRVVCMLVLGSLMISGVMFGQEDKDVKIGKEQLMITGTTLHNFGDPNKVNIVVNVWGAASAGKYIVPEGTTFLDMISLCTPAANAQLENIRLLRPKNDSLNRKQDSLATINIKDYYFEEELQKKDIKNFTMMPGDVLIFQVGPTPWFFRDYLIAGLSVGTLLVTIANLIVTATR